MGKLRTVAWVHIMDNTEGIEENEPWTRISFDEKNPFGVSGIDFSASSSVRSFPLQATHSVAAMKSMATRASRERLRKTKNKP